MMISQGVTKAGCMQWIWQEFGVEELRKSILHGLPYASGKVGKWSTPTSPTEVRNSTWQRRDLRNPDRLVDSSWNVMAHGAAREGKWRVKLSNAVGSQYPSQYLRTWCIQHYSRWCAQFGCQRWTKLTSTGRFKWTLPFGCKDEIWFLCAWPSHFKCSLEIRKETRSVLGSSELRTPQFVTSIYNLIILLKLL